MRYRFEDGKPSADGLSLLSRIIWDIEGSWPVQNGAFPPEHPSHRFKEEFAALRGRGYDVIFSSHDGHSCALNRQRNQSNQDLFLDLDECLGWDRVEAAE